MIRHQNKKKLEKRKSSFGLQVMSIINGSQGRNKARAWSKNYARRLLCPFYYTAHAHLLRNNTARSGLDPPPNTYIKTMACSHVHRIVWWKQFLSWSLLFPGDSLSLSLVCGCMCVLYGLYMFSCIYAQVHIHECAYGDRDQILNVSFSSSPL